LDDHLAALAGAGASTLVSAAGTEAWESTLIQFRRLADRDDASGRSLSAELDAMAAKVSAPGDQWEALRPDLVRSIRKHLGVFLAHHPETADELRELIARTRRDLPADHVADQIGDGQPSTGYQTGVVDGHGVDKAPPGPDFPTGRRRRLP
jgi:adenylate kinase